MTTQDNDEYEVVFRRFRKTKSGAILDAYKFGIKAWPIKRRKGDKDENGK